MKLTEGELMLDWFDLELIDLYTRGETQSNAPIQQQTWWPKVVKLREFVAAAENEVCCRDVCSLCAGVNPSYGPAIYTSPSSDLPPSWQHPNIETGNPWDAVPCLAAAIRERGAQDERQ